MSISKLVCLFLLQLDILSIPPIYYPFIHKYKTIIKEKNMKRIVTIQDISCVGKCSITVALPIISAMGTETAILPTAVLSTHTMFTGFTVKDLQDQIEPISAHWKSQKINFDLIYTGYLANKEQIELVKQFFKEFGSGDVLKFVDPAMADNGALYWGFDEEFAKTMASLCGEADIIVPNLTEACFMTDTPYRTDYDIEYIHATLKKLAALGTKKYVVITGVSEDVSQAGFTGLDVETGEFFTYGHDRIDKLYHGTGDIFASVTVGALERDYNIYDALKLAADFTKDCVAETLENDPEKTYGVDFEAVLPRLINKL